MAREVTVAPVMASTPSPTLASPVVPMNWARKSVSVRASRPRPSVSSRSRTTRPVTLPASLTKKFAVSRLRVYVSLDNFFCFSPYWGMDPEAVNATSAMGADYGNYPTPKTLTFGANLSF